MRYVIDTDRLLTLLKHHGILLAVDEGGVAVEVVVKERGSLDYKVVGYSKDFEDFWNAYPRKVKKPEAFRAWVQTQDVRPDFGAMMAATTNFYNYCLREGTETRFIPHPASWLRAYRWEDSYDEMCRKPKQADDSKIRIYRKVQDESEEFREHPMWSSYRNKVMSGQIKPGFKEFIGEDK